MDDIYSLLVADEPTAQEKAAQMAAALRRTQSAAAANRGLSMVAGLGQNNLLAGLGKSSANTADQLAQQAQFGQGQLAQAGNAQAGRALQKAMAADRRRQELYDESSRRRWQEGRDQERYKQELLQAQTTAGLRSQEREDRLADKKEAKDALLYAPGYERGPKGTIKPEEAQKFRDALASKGALMDSLQEMRQLYEEHGTELGGDVASKMSSQARDMLLQLKNLAKLGVLSKSDEDIINAIVPNPTTMSANLKSFVGMDTTNAQLDELERQVEAKTGAHAQSLGYVPDAPAPSAKGSADDTVMVQPPDGRPPVRVHRSRLEEAIKRGGKVVSGG